MEPYISRGDLELGDYLGAAADVYRYNVELYSMPISVHTRAAAYNKTLFAKAGLPNPGRSWHWEKDVLPTAYQSDPTGRIRRLGK